MARLSRFLLLLTLCYYSGMAVAVTNFTRLSVDDGLPNASIYKIMQDKKGYIWLGSTNTGLLRYNGYEFESFDVLPSGVSKNVFVPDIDALLTDQNNQLWIGSWGMGLTKVDIESGQLSHYSNAKDSSLALVSNYIQTLFLDQSGALWIGTREGLQRLMPDGRLLHIGSADAAQPLSHQRIWAISQTKDGIVWIATSHGLHQWSEQSGLSAAYLPFPPSDPQNELRTLFSQGNKLWIGGRSALFEFDRSQNSFVSVPFFDGVNSPIINVLDADKQGNLLVGTFDGIYKVSLNSGQFEPFADSRQLLPGINVRSLLVDRSGLLWVGSREKGLFYGRHQQSAFSDLTQWGGKAALLAKESVTAVRVEDRYLWLGAREQLHRIKKPEGTVQSYSVASRINAISRTPDGDLYLGTDTGLWRFDEAKGQLEQQSSDQSSGLSQWQNVRDLISMPDGSLWLGLWQQGLMRWDPAGPDRSWLTDMSQQKAGDAVQVVQNIHGKIWIGTRYSGVFVMDPQTLELQDLTDILPAEQAVDIQCLSEGPDGTVLICSRDGVLLLDRASRLVSGLGNIVHLPATELSGAYTDAQKNIWLLSSRGLSLKPYQQDRLITFTEQDGLSNKEIIFKAFSVSERGNLYLGTAAGLSIVKTDLLWINDHRPGVDVSAVWIDQEKLSPGIMTSAWPELKLQPEQSISMELVSLDFHDPSRNQFIYQLEGVDKTWRQGAGLTRVYYSQLEPGTYQFKVLGSNQHGLFNLQPYTMSIEVLPTWWQQTWVHALTVIVVLMLILGGHAYRLRHIRQVNRLLQHSVQERSNTQLVLETMVSERTKALEESSATLSLRSKQLELSLSQLAENNKELKRLNNLKDEFISTVSHELRTPLTSIRGAVGLLASKAVAEDSEHYHHLLQTALGNSERLSQLINDLLDLQKFESGNFSLELAPLDLKALVLQAIESISPFAGRYQVDIQTQLADACVNADKNRIRQVVDNLLSNAIKFSSVGQPVMVRLTVQQQIVHLEVQDQGTGIPQDFQARVFEKFSQADGSSSRKVEGTGLGLNICKTIISAHHGRIGFYSQPGQGALFWFELPLHRS